MEDPITRLVRETRREQGLPEKVTDPATLARIAVLLDPQAEPMHLTGAQRGAA